LSYAELSAWVARYAAGLRASGVSPGDRVAGLMPNIPETVLAMLATTGLGAIWSSCSPDFGDRAVIDRFGQIRPKVLFAADRYRYAGREVDLIPRIREIAGSLVGLGQVVIVPCGEGGQAEQRTSGPKRGPADQRTGGQQPPIPRGVWVADWLEAGATVRPAVTPPVRFPFDHPVYIVYSSGTTGLPKCIVHGAGGTLIQHLKELVLHTDLGRDDRIFYYTTCGWMMWNWLVSSLAVGATVVLYDGAPFASSPDILWRMAEEERVTVFGTSAKYLARCEKEGISPWRDRNLSALRTILSTGSPLAAHSFDYVYREIKGDVHLASISGGTDLLSCFALGNPTAPVWRGELQCRGLGMAVEVWTPEGRSVTGQAGELVCTRPFPSMPVAFWSDPDAARYREAYFSRWPGVWRHGDWAELTPHEGLIIYGRSDATLNPGGIRIGTAEIYRQVERLPEVEESLVVGQEWEEDVRVILFVRLRQGIALDEGLRQRIREEIRCHASPHHVPKKIIQVPDLPRTLNGKLSELAVKAMIHGRSIGNADALANPEALAFFQNHPELAS
jgi:acetoacetyl-CoA synthetase